MTASNTNNKPSHFVYVIAYDAKYDSSTTLYLKTYPKTQGVTDIQQAHRFASYSTAVETMKKLKYGNPRIEKHRTCISAEPHAVYFNETT